MKKSVKTGLIGGTFAIILVAAGILAWYFGIKIPHDEAYQAYLEKVEEYNGSVQQFNSAVDLYNNKAKEVILIDDAFDAVIQNAQDLVDSGQEPYEGAKLTKLSNSIKDARNYKEPLPELRETMAVIQPDPSLEKEKKDTINAESEKLRNDMESIDKNSEVLLAQEAELMMPDYSEYIRELEENSKELEDSFSVQNQITAPTEEWVITRLGRVSDVANMAPVTEENDPNGHLNKPGGYTSTVYFGTSMLRTEELTGNALIDAGTIAGGAIETYRSVEDAQARCDYLAAFDGSIFASGSHVVLGTMLIRTSDDLKASQQETLTNEIINAMTSLE